MTFATLAPTLAVELVALAFAGGASISFMASGNSTLQLDRRARDAGSRDVAVVRRLPGLDADRRPDRRLGDGRARRPRRPRARRDHVLVVAPAGGVALAGGALRASVELEHSPDARRARRSAARRPRCVLCTANDARVVADTPSLRISGCAQ